MEQILYSKYSNERSRAFAIRTDIKTDENGRFVEKSALYLEGRMHIEKLYSRFTELGKLYQEIPFLCNHCEKTEHGVRLEYLQEETLEEKLDSLLAFGQTDDAGNLLINYLEQIRQIHSKEPFVETEEFHRVFGQAELPDGMTSAKLTNIDMVCANVVLTQPPTILDYEWTFDFPIPCEFVLYRIIHYYIDIRPEREILDAEFFYRQFGITQEARKCFGEMEKRFQEYLTQGHTPMREMFAAMTPGVRSDLLAEGEMLRVYFFTGKGYTDTESEAIPIRGNKVSGTFDLPKGCTMIRLDPGDHPCSVLIRDISFDQKPADLKNVLIPGGIMTEKWVYMAKPDPNLSDIMVPEGSRKLSVSMEVYPGTEAMLEVICGMGRENIRLRSRLAEVPQVFWEMKKTKLWKLFKKCHKRAERK